MKLAVVGSRDFVDWTRFQSMVDAMRANFPEISSLVSGGARGPDKLAEMYAKIDLMPIKVFGADWSQGPFAGFARNQKIVDECDIALVVWDGRSSGTLDTINKLAKAKKPFTVFLYEVDELDSYNYGKLK